MFLHLPAYVWVLVAALLTPAHIAFMRYAMPTPKGKKSVSFIPLVLGAAMLMSAAVKGYSFSVTLYWYSAVLLIFVIMIAPVRRRVAADILRQEQTPDIKVKVDKVSLVWITFSMIGTIGIAVAVWASNT
ncbi:hypothetical protein AB0C21_32100 [Spirillospora sp. NPDC049024]